MKEWNGVLEDLGRMRAALPEDRCVKLLESAARLSAGHVRREPLEVAGQMHARLMGYGDVLGDFLGEILEWRVPNGLKGWWRLVGQTVDPAGEHVCRRWRGILLCEECVVFSRWDEGCVGV